LECNSAIIYGKNHVNGSIESFWSQLIFWQRKYWQNLMDLTDDKFILPKKSSCTYKESEFRFNNEKTKFI